MSATIQRAVRVAPALHTYLQLITSGARGYLEIRYRHQDEMWRLFGGTRRLAAAAETIAALSARTDVYCGVVLRTRHAGGRDAIDSSHLVWVEIDHPDALERLDTFAHPATMTVRSGTAGHAHAYWQLDRRVDVEALEHANRRLAHHLGADLASTDAARILRPCGTLNHKHTPPTPVSLAAYRPARRYALAELLQGLADPAPTRANRPSSSAPAAGWASREDAQLRAIPTEQYVHALTGRHAGRDHKVACPFHDADRTPSLHCYADGTWFCFGCRRGGSIYDFAGALWGVPTKGPAFPALRRRLLAEEELG